MSERANKLNRRLDLLLGIPLVALSSGLRRGFHGDSGETLEKIRQTGQIRSIGIICLGAIGDLLLLSTLTGALRRHLDARGCDAPIFLLTSRGNAAALPLLPGIDAASCASFAVRDLPGMIRFLRSRRPDVLIDSTQWARVGALLCNLSGANVCVGFDTPGQHRASGYDLPVPHRNDQHESRNFLALGQALFPDLPDLESRLVLPRILPETEGHLAAFSGTKRIFLHLWPSGSGTPLKEWPEEHWVELARALLERGFELCLTGSPADAPRTELFLARHFPGDTRLSSLAGKTSLPALAWLLARCGAAISVNTGVMHLAALCGAPTVALNGPTNPRRWGPLGPATRSLLPRQGLSAYLNLGFEFPERAAPCLPFLPVEDVLRALDELGVFSSHHLQKDER